MLAITLVQSFAMGPKQYVDTSTTAEGTQSGMAEACETKTHTSEAKEEASSPSPLHHQPVARRP